MTRRGQKKHLKRLPAPKFWPVKRKHGKFAPRVIPGPHGKGSSIPLAILLREVLGYASTMREIKGILSTGQVMVDRKIRKDPRFPIGVMDVVELQLSGERFRVLPKVRGGLKLVTIGEDEAGFKLCRIEKKKVVSGGNVQITLHDGRSIILPDNVKPSTLRTLDTVKITVPKQEMLGSIPLEKGAHAVITQGRNVGVNGVVLDVQKRFGTNASTVTVQDPEGNKFETALEYVFAIGQKKPEVSVESAGGAV